MEMQPFLYVICNVNSLCCSFPQERRRPWTTTRSLRRSSSTTPRSDASLSTGTCPRASTTRRTSWRSWGRLDAGSTCSFCFVLLSPSFLTMTWYRDAPRRAKNLRAWPAARVGPTYAGARGSWKISQMGLPGMTRRRQVLHAHLEAGQWIDCPSLRRCPMIHSPAGPHSIYRRCCDSTSRALPPLIIKPFMFSAALFVCLSSATFILAVLLFVGLSHMNVMTQPRIFLPVLQREERPQAQQAGRRPRGAREGEAHRGRGQIESQGEMEQILTSPRELVLLVLKQKVGAGLATDSASMCLKGRGCIRLINKVFSFFFQKSFLSFFFIFPPLLQVPCNTSCPPWGRVHVHLEMWKLLLERLRLALFRFRLTSAVARQIRLHKQTLHTKDDVRPKQRDKPESPVYFTQQKFPEKPLSEN